MIEEDRKMITKFGKELRKIRIDNEENLSMMSKKLGVSISYLSAIENGVREIPQDFIQKIIANYRLSRERIEILFAAEAEAASKVSIPLNSTLSEQRQLAFMLSRKLNDLSLEECKAIMRLLGDDNDGK